MVDQDIEEVGASLVAGGGILLPISFIKCVDRLIQNPDGRCSRKEGHIFVCHVCAILRDDCEDVSTNFASVYSSIENWPVLSYRHNESMTSKSFKLLL